MPRNFDGSNPVDFSKADPMREALWENEDFSTFSEALQSSVNRIVEDISRELRHTGLSEITFDWLQQQLQTVFLREIESSREGTADYASRMKESLETAWSKVYGDIVSELSTVYDQSDTGQHVVQLQRRLDLIVRGTIQEYTPIDRRH